MSMLAARSLCVNLFLFLNLISLPNICFSYVVPAVTIQAFMPKGFRAYIPDAEGLKVFTIHANLNGSIRPNQPGSVIGEVLAPSGSRWVYENTKTVLEVGDVMNYWVFVQNGEVGFISEGSFRVNKLVTKRPLDDSTDPTVDSLQWTVDGPYSGQPTVATDPACTPSSTVVIRGYRPDARVCTGQLVFEESFERYRQEVWQVEQKIPRDDQENPFVSYQNREYNVRVQNGQLKIRPSLLQNTPPHDAESIIDGELDIYNGCTEQAGLCSYKASGFNILPPVISARINSKPSFAFKYGIIEIRAKLPRGDWIYPELLLEPLNNRYGLEKYSSGVIRVAFARGNVVLRRAGAGDQQIGNKLLAAGVVLDQFQCHERFLNETYGDEDWGEDFHDYKVEWLPDKITFSVDGRAYGGVEAAAFHSELRGCLKTEQTSARWSTGTALAPFDQEFYISLGVGVGGVTDFPNDSITSMGHRKPWGNTNNKAKLTFWRDLANWFATWTPDSQMVVDHVKVTAL